MALVPSCTCPITKTMTVNFTGSITPPSSGYIVKWKTASASTYNIVSPNPTASPVTIYNVPVCEDITVVMQSQCDNSQVSAEQTTSITKATMYACGSSITGSHTHSGYYKYADYILDCTGASGDVSLSVNAIDKPNKFSVYDPFGNLVATSGSPSNSGWLGTASYFGPWGATLNAPSTGTVSFTPTSCWYKLVVESSTDVSFQDGFSVGVGCIAGSATPTPDIRYLTCSGGYGQYIIEAPVGTTLRVALTATGQLTNVGVNGYCARLEGSITSSTGQSISAWSAPVNGSAGVSIGSSSSLYIDVTIPSAGYLTINTNVMAINSTSSQTTGSIKIISVNGTDVIASNYTQSVCTYNSTGTISCSSTAGTSSGSNQ